MRIRMYQCVSCAVLATAIAGILACNGGGSADPEMDASAVDSGENDASEPDSASDAATEDAAVEDGSGSSNDTGNDDDAGLPSDVRESEGPLDRTGLSMTPIGSGGPCGVPARVDEAPLIRLPYLQSVFPSSARVAWTAPRDGHATVRYAPLGSDQWREVDANARPFPMSYTGYLEDYVAYDATMVGLEPETIVCYELWFDGLPVVAGAGFETAITSHDRPLSILALGDSGTGSGEQYRVSDQMAAINADVFLHLGDMAYGEGTFFQFELFMFQVYAPIMHRLAMWPTIGNHEYKTNFGQPYLDVYYLPEMAVLPEDQEYFYSFDYGNVHFVSVDSNDRRLLLSIGDVEDDMLEWLEADLEASDAEWKIVFMHHPPYSSSERDINRLVRSSLLPIFERTGVDLVLAGHDHHYERTIPILSGEPNDTDEAITYIVSGAGGAGLRFAYGDWFTASMFHARHSFMHIVIDGCTAYGRSVDLNGVDVDVFEINGCD